MLCLLSACLSTETRDTPSVGFHHYDVPPHTVLAIENPEVRNRMVVIWSGEGDDDPSVVIACTLWGIVYIHHPILINYVFPVGELVRFKSDAPVQVQVWVLPIDFCAPTTFFYSATVSISDEFTLTGKIANGLCLFFDNPSMKNHVVAQIKSKRVDYSESRVEVIGGSFDRLECEKNRCTKEVNDRFFIRFVGANAGLRLLVETEFEKNEALAGCARNAIPVWDGNLSYTGILEVSDEEFLCDDPAQLMRKKQKKWLLTLGGGFVVVFAILLPYCSCIGMKNREERMPQQLQEMPVARPIFKPVA
jgi:hypothetical protein